MTRLLDIVLGIVASIVFAPVVLIACFMVWRHDRADPLYRPRRIGLHGEPFTLYKIRSMVKDADRNQVDTTVEGDTRILPVGKTIRRYKLDELPQFWNVVLGDLSLVGPRPNVQREVALYTGAEQRILSVKPGLTDFSSIVFSDLGDRLAGKGDPNIAYNQLIRPWKGRLSLFYIDNRSVWADLALLAIAFIAIFNKPLGMRLTAGLLKRLGAEDDLIDMVEGRLELQPLPPVGSKEIVQVRESTQ